MVDLPDTWRAAVLVNAGDELEIREVLRPELLEGQLLVRLTYSGVCRSQLMEVRGQRGPDRWAPHLLGHEGLGIVEQVGPGVTKVLVGDRVIVGWIAGEGLDAKPPVFHTPEGERINAGQATTFSEWTVVSENRIYRAPQQIADRTAVLFGCALLTGAGMVLNDIALGAGQTVLVNGLGGIGLSAVVAALGVGGQVVAVDPDTQKQRIARHLGASMIVDPLSSSDMTFLRREYPNGFDFAIDASGSVAGIEFAFSTVSYQGGTLVFASHPPVGEVMRIDPHDLIRGRRIQGSWGGSSLPDRDIPILADFLSRRSEDLGFMTPVDYPLTDVNRALEDLEAQRSIRPLIRF